VQYNSLKAFDISGSEINGKIENGFMKKIITIDYNIPKNDEYSQTSTSDNEWENFGQNMALGIIEMFKLNFIITVPGVITETTGKIISANTVKWSFSMLDVLQNGKRIYLKSEISLSPANKLSAQKNAESKILEYYSQIDEINFKINKIKAMTDYQVKINKNIILEKEKSDTILIKSLNSLVELYHSEYGNYPNGLEDINIYSQKQELGNIPKPFNGQILYNNQNHTFRLLK